MTTIILVRHARSTWNDEAETSAVERFGGPMTQRPLSSSGEAQSRQLGRVIAGMEIQPAAFYASRAVRAITTCRLSTGKDPQILGELAELSWGDWNGRSRDILKEPDVAAARSRDGFCFRPPNGESHDDVRKRAMRALWRIHSQQGDRDHVLVVTHQNFIKNVVRNSMRWRTLGELEAAKVDTCSFTTVKMIAPGRLDLVSFNQQTL